MPFGLNEDSVIIINNIFSSFPDVKEVLLYGSRAKGNYRNGSDIDLVIKGDRLNLQLLNNIRMQIDDLMLPYTFDISAYNDINNEDLISHIDRIGKVFFTINSD